MDFAMSKKLKADVEQGLDKMSRTGRATFPLVGHPGLSLMEATAYEAQDPDDQGFPMCPFQYGERMYYLVKA